jgi:3-deoxy-D-manno-octulosonic-acid transferase
MTGRQRALLTAYGLAWWPALPLLALSPRLRQGFGQRLVPSDWAAAARWRDVWVQAASVGEAQLARELVAAFDRGPCRRDKETHFLLTAMTAEGMAVCNKARSWTLEAGRHVSARTAYFPFDSPRLMRRALGQTLPKVVVLLETELWPGLLWACKREDVPVLVVNGRMRSKSLAGYLALGGLFRQAAPRRILAVSEADARRFGALFGPERVTVMPNIKFDRVPLPGAAPAEAPAVDRVLSKSPSFAVLGSVRAEEEEQVRAMLQTLHAERPRTTIGLFPRHLQRVEAWERHLRGMDLPFVRRSRTEEPAPPGSVVLWDVMGELDAAYARARAAFVGGSLRPLGGQNFLEPMAHGIAPVIGPHWSNFAWVGREAVDLGLVHEARDAKHATTLLLKNLQRPADPESVQKRFQAYLAERRGGTEQACRAVAEFLD